MAGRKKASSAMATWDFWWNQHKWPLMEARLHDDARGITPRAERQEQPDAHPLADKVERDLVLSTLLRGLNDRYAPSRESALLALGKSQHPSAVPAILEALRDKNNRVSQAAILALGLHKKASSVFHLTSILEDRTAGRKLLGSSGRISDQERQTAAFALGLLGDKDATASLMRVLEKSKDDDLRVFCANALGLHGDTTAVPLLLKIARTKREPDLVRGAALSSLRISDASKPEVREVLLASLKSRDFEVVRGAALTCGAVGKADDQRLVTALANASDEGGDVEARGLCLVALGQIGGPLALQEILDRAHRRGPIAGFAALSVGLAASQHEQLAEESRKRLIKMIAKTRDQAHRQACMVSLGLIGDSRDIPQLMESATKGKNAADRAYAMAALGLIGDRNAIPMLLETVKSEGHPVIRHEAALALGQVAPGDPIATQHLVNSLSSAPNNYERVGCAHMLDLINDASAVDPLRKLVVKVDSSPDSRAFASGTLGLLLEDGQLSRMAQVRDQSLAYLDLPELRRLLLML